MGDYNGVGPEVILKSLTKIDLSDSTPVILGNASVFEFYAEQLNISSSGINIVTSAKDIKEGEINLLHCAGDDEVTIKPGEVSKQAGEAAMKAIKTGVEYCLQDKMQALVTAPISKEAVNRAGYHIPGHTEFLAKKTGAEHYLMLLVHETLRVGLVTTHIPVSEVSSIIQTENVLSYVKIMHETLKRDFNINEPKIAVLGLNPHAGDGGIIGDEEFERLKPAIEQAQAAEIIADGPHSADGFFGNQKYKKYDGVLAMYHDQGLVPFKTLSFGSGINVTTGLPFIRTSPDHGTAFDIAGQNQADESSFLAAYNLACKLVENRKK